jgi:hypothetical protein
MELTSKRFEWAMPIYELASEEIRLLHKTTFGQMQLYERRDLQRLLRESISVIAPNTLVIAEEFGETSPTAASISSALITTRSLS